jgi:hypothetical protein
MIANGLPLVARHSTVSVVELNGPNPDRAAGSLPAAAALRPTETVFAQIAFVDQHHQAGLAGTDPRAGFIAGDTA